MVAKQSSPGFLPLTLTLLLLISAPLNSHAIDAQRASRNAEAVRFVPDIQGAVQGLVDSIVNFTSSLPGKVSGLQQGVMQDVFSLIGPMVNVVAGQVAEFSGIFDQVSSITNSISSLESVQGNIGGLIDFNQGNLNITQSLEGLIGNIGASATQDVLGQITGRLEGVQLDFMFTEFRLDSVTAELGELTGDIPALDSILSTEALEDMIPEIELGMQSSIDSISNEIAIKDFSIDDLEVFQTGELASLGDLANQGDLQNFNSQADSYISSNNSESIDLDAQISNLNIEIDGLTNDRDQAIEAGDMELAGDLQTQLKQSERERGTAQTRQLNIQLENEQISSLQDMASTEGLASVSDSMPALSAGIDSAQDILGEGSGALTDLKGDMQFQLDDLSNQPLEGLKDYMSGFSNLIPSYTSKDLGGTGIGGGFGEITNQLSSTVSSFTQALPDFGSISQGLSSLGSLGSDFSANISSLNNVSGQLGGIIGGLSSQLGSLQGQLSSLLGPLQESFGDLSNLSGQYISSTELLNQMAGIIDSNALTQINTAVSEGLTNLISNVQNLVPNLSSMLSQSFGSFLRVSANARTLRAAGQPKLFAKVNFELGSCKKPLRAFKIARGAKAFKKKKQKFRQCQIEKSGVSPQSGGTTEQQQKTMALIVGLKAKDQVGQATQELYGINFVEQLETIKDDMRALYNYMVLKYPQLIFNFPG